MKYTKLFQTSDWMVTVPQEFEKFFGAAYPNGISALMVFSSEKWELYNRIGKKLYCLPYKGDERTDRTILDVIVQKTTIHIYDIISWKG